MPTHAKILATLLVINLLLGALPLIDGVQTQALISLVIRILLLLGFLKGSEGVRTLLLLGAGISVIFGAFGIMAALPLLGASSSMGLIALASGAWSAAVGLYMLWALKNAELTHWMLNRSLGGALDDE